MIDIEIVRSYPDSGHYYISPGIDSVQYYMINHGPDTIFPTDGYYTSIKFANVIIDPKIGYVNATIVPGDSLEFTQQLVLEYYNHRPSVDLCIRTYVFESDRSDIYYEKDSAEMYANNQPCTKVGHNRVELGISDHAESSDLIVYPNPAYGIIKLEFKRNILSYDIINTQGDLVYAQNEVNLKEIDADISGLSSGLYFLRIHTLKGYVTRKLVVLD
jgi:hypothetical protein